MTDLLPCPFCGSPAERHDVEEREDVENAGASYIECTKCGACTQLHFGRKENLYSAWNDRERTVERERDAIADRTRYIASQYPRGSDGRNTFILLAEWIEARTSTVGQGERDNG